MHLAPRLDELEARTKRRRQIFRGITLHRQARAHLRAVVGERRDDHASTGSECVVQRCAVPTAIVLVDEEVEDGSVVPQLVAAIRLPLEEIRSDAPHGCVGGKPGSGRVERRGRDVEHRDIGEATGDELVGEERSPTADVDHGRLGRDPERLHQLERHGRSGLIPAHAGDSARGIRLVPVFDASHAFNLTCRAFSTLRTYVRLSTATILHADLDAFFASVEQRDDPRLRGRPVLVGGGVVLAASYEAKAYGIKTAMGGRQARRLCPHAVVVPSRMSAYSEASKAVFAVFEDTTPLVEGLSIDEAFLDVRGLERLAGPPPQIAARLRERILDEVGLPITVGIARTKFLAKVASAVAKPNGLLVVPSDDELGFLHPLPVERLWGVGRVTAGKLHDRGLRTVGQVAVLDEALLVALLGRASGRHTTRWRTTATRGPC